MNRIERLPDDVITRIAAGEVIDRPASVVRELLDNSLDAGAARIDVELEAGGAAMIRVADTGHGIAADQLPLAVARHATSKLRTADDLWRIGTLGFRGEALAAIGSVSRLRVRSRRPGDAAGAEIRCDGGAVSAVRAWAGSAGTIVEAAQLFFNTPVRRQFLKSAATELGHVEEALVRAALAHPEVHFGLRHESKRVVEVPATVALPDRIGLFFGRDVRDALLRVEQTAGPARLTGYVGHPACDRGNAKLQYLFVNGRCVRDRALGHAIQEGYRGLILSGRHPVAFLFLTIEPDAVDVNVHPTKSEVRFRDPQAVYALVLSAIRSCLRLADLYAEPSARPPAEPVGWKDLEPEPTAAVDRSEPPPENPAPEPPPPTREDRPPCFQLHDAYIVVESPDGILVIDQHALHERILFEQLRRRVRSGQLEKQRLLIPEPVELTAGQAARLLEVKDELAELGLEVEPFGGGTVLVTAYPALLGRVAPGDIARAVVDQLLARDRPPDRDELLHQLLATMACRAAVKAGDKLTPEEVSALVSQRLLAENSHHCPHGRPTSLHFSRRELDRQFRRT